MAETRSAASYLRVGNGEVGTANERAARRAHYRRRELAEAEERSNLVGRSIKCGQYDQHAPDGCQNDGSHCLCECHDPKRVTS